MKNTTIALIQTSWPGGRAQMIMTYRELVAEAAELTSWYDRKSYES